MMKTSDILVMGELNVDLILSGIHQFPQLGTEVLADNMVLTLGGSSAIFASNAAALGNGVSFLGKVGTDYFGKFIIDALKANNVKTAAIIRSADYVTGATIAMSYGEERAMVTHPGAMNFLSGENLSEELLKGSRHFHLASLFLQPLVKRDIVSIFRRAKSVGLTTSLDPQWDPNEKWDVDWAALLPSVDVFLPNQKEALAITSESSVDRALEKLALLGNSVVIKLGTEGSMAMSSSSPGQVLRAEPFLNRNTVDAIGAGDSFDAGFVSRYIRGGAIADCLRFGNLTGAISTTAAGGTAAFSSLEKVKATARDYFGVSLEI